MLVSVAGRRRKQLSTYDLSKLMSDVDGANDEDTSTATDHQQPVSTPDNRVTVTSTRAVQSHCTVFDLTQLQISDST